MGRGALVPPLVVGHHRDMERIVATYRVEDHEVDVVEMVDEDRTWFDLAIDGAVLPLGDQPQSEPDEVVVMEVVRTWLAANG